jgi:hypothetical protein
MERGRLMTLVFLGFSLSAALGAGPPPCLTAAQADDDIEESILIFNRGKLLHQERQYRGAIKRISGFAPARRSEPSCSTRSDWRLPRCALRLRAEGLQPGTAAKSRSHRRLQQHRDGLRRAGRRRRRSRRSLARCETRYTTPERRSITWATSTSRMATSSSRKCISEGRWKAAEIRARLRGLARSISR